MLNIVKQDYRLIPAKLLRPHPHNPNRGDREAIAESIEVNGFYGAVLVRKHPTNEGEFEILAGEHRMTEAVSAAEGDLEVGIPCIIAEYDDVGAARVLLADNETAKRSTYDADELTHVLHSLGTLEGTGFTLAELGEFEDERQRNEPKEPEEFVREYGVVIYCDDEQHQQEIYEKLRAEGLRVRVASI